MSANNDGLPKELDALPPRDLSPQQLCGRMARWMELVLFTPEEITPVPSAFRVEQHALLAEARRRGWL
jgi:hypothetical protein